MILKQHKSHRLDDKVAINKALLVRFGDEAMLGYRQHAFDAFIETSAGELRRHTVGKECDAIRQMIATDLLMHANKHIAHDGAWSCVWIGWQAIPPKRGDSHYARLVFLWMDADGDVNFPVEIEESLATYSNKGIHHWVNQLEQAWHAWKHMMVDTLDLSENQKIRVKHEAANGLAALK